MGLIKNIIGGVFSLIGGVFGSIAKVFGLGKKGEFFMELDESGAIAAAPESAPLPAATQPTVEAPAKPAPAAKPAKQAKKTAEPKGAAKKAAPEPVATVKMPTVPEAPAIKNFATDYLVNPQLMNTSRRRPGPSVSPFKEMAKSLGKKSPSVG